MAEKPADTPLVALEKEVEGFKKELEDKIKVFSKIEYNPKKIDAEKYKESADVAVNELNHFNEKCNDFLKRIGELKKENEAATLKDKDLEKRKANEVKKVKDYIKKIEKALDKFKQDGVKIEKETQKKKNTAATGMSISSLAKVFKPNKDALKPEEKKEELAKTSEEPKKTAAVVEEEDDDESMSESESDGDEGVEDVETERSESKGLKTLMAEKLAKDKKTGKSLMDLVTEDIKSKESSKKLNLDDSLIRKKKVESEDEDDQTDLRASATIRSENETTENDNVLKSYENQLLSTGEEVQPQPPAPVILKKMDSNSSLIKKEEKPRVEDKKKPVEEIKKKKAPEVSDVSGDESEEFSSESEEELKQSDKVKRNIQVDDDDDDDDDDEEETSYELGTKFVTVNSFKGEQKGDLPFKENEVLTLVAVNDENWYLVKNDKGREGLAPKNFLKVLEVAKPAKEKKKVLETQRSTDSNKSGLELWGLVKEQINNKTLLDPEALKANGLVPGSFSSSALEKLSHDLEYSYLQFLTPKLTESNLMFKNFFWEMKANRIRSRTVTFQRILTINKCTHIPVPKTDELTVLGRFVRVCLFDGKKVLSNIHIIKAYVENDETTWFFNSSVDEFSKISECSEMFIRCQMPTQTSPIGILFELSMHCLKKTTNEESHLACGWLHLPFIDEEKNTIQNKSYDFILNGGNVFDAKGKPLNEDLARLRPNPSLLDTLIDKLFRESKIKFDVDTPKDRLSDRLNCLPEPLVSSTILAPFMKYYLEELGLNLLKPLVEAGLTQMEATSIHSPFLASFIKALKYPDILDAVKLAFDKKKGLMTRDQRNDDSYRRKVYVELFSKIAYPLLYHSTLPEIQLYSDAIMDARDTIIERHWQAVIKNNILKSLLNENEEFEPFDINEACYETVNEFSY